MNPTNSVSQVGKRSVQEGAINMSNSWNSNEPMETRE